MLKTYPTLKDLFKQLGLPNNDEDIHSFIERHRPIPETMKLHQVPCWTPAQSAFLEKAIADDGNWSYVADELDTTLRK